MVSIIVPVYNAERYLRRCVDSVLAQTEREFQLILVNDGSADASGKICDEYAAKDSRVTVIHQKNAGVSAARNVGLDAAKGEYIGFVDADDRIAADTYEQALAAMGECDIVMWDTVTVLGDGQRLPDTIELLPQDQLLRKNDWTPELLRYMAGSACRCLYKAELLKDIRFPVGIKLSEDRLFNLEAMGKAETISYMKRGLYDRFVIEGSACNSFHADLFEKGVRANSLAQEILLRYWGEQYCSVYVRLFVIQGALTAIYQLCRKNSPHQGVHRRLAQIRSITGSEALVSAFAKCEPRGIQQKLLQKKADLLLLAAGVLYCLKNRG